MAVDPRATFPDFVESHDLLPLIPWGKLLRLLGRWELHTNEYNTMYDRLLNEGLTFRDWSVTWFEGALITLRTYYTDDEWALLFPPDIRGILPEPSHPLLGYLQGYLLGWQQYNATNQDAQISFTTYGATYIAKRQEQFVILYITATMCQLEVGRMLEKILHLKPPIIIA